MMDTSLLFIPTRVLLDARGSHDLPYINDRRFDYTYSNFCFIPHAISAWADSGLDLSRDFIERCWRDFADKREGNELGELNRTSKLLLDALKAVYDHAAFAEYTQCQVMYRPKDDMLGRDLQIHVPDIGPVWLQLRVEIYGNYTKLKRQRLQGRGVDVYDAIDCCAYRKDVDERSQPWFPKPWWYVETIQRIKAMRLSLVSQRLGVQ